MREEEKVVRYIKSDLNREKLFAVAMGVLRNRDDAEDAVQDCLLSCWRSRKKFKGQSKVGTWIYRTLLNASFMHYRREKKHAGRQDTDAALDGLYSPAPTPERFYYLQEALMLALRSIGEKYRAPFLLRLHYGYSINEISAVTGLKAGTVKAIVHRTRKQAIFALEKKPDDSGEAKGIEP